MIFSAVQLTELLDNDARTDNQGWACEVCKQSRLVHVDLWMSRLSQPEAVEIKALFERAAADLGGLEGGRPYAANIRVRVESVESYLNGGSPIIPTGTAEEEAQLRVLVDEYRSHSACARLLREVSAAV